MRIFLSSALLLATVSFADAQDRPIARAGLPRAVEARLTAVIDNPQTRQITGEATLSETHDGDVVVFTGPLALSGRINGELIVIDGNIDFREGSAVSGDVTLVGGDATGLENAEIGGTVTMYGEGFGVFRGSEKVYTVNRHNRRVYREDYRRDWGHSSFAVRTGWNYNRVEGLPVQFGPVIETGGRNPTRFEALAIWRTEVSAPWETEDLGYTLRAEQFIGGRRDFRVGASLRSVVDPIETWQLNKLEASLAAFVLHEDHRDYFKREGWSGYLQWAPRASGLTATVEYRDEDHFSEPARDPWTLFDNGDRWRPQPLIAEGKLRSIHGSVSLDRRDDTDFPASGFYLRTEVTRGLSGRLSIPGIMTDPSGPGPATAFDEEVTSGLIDARIYRLVGRDATLSFRFVGAGSIDDKPLPPQFQHAFGGAGSLPGYASFSADCGARNGRVSTGDGSGNMFFPYYGCDRMALFSAEYRGGFDFHWGGFDVWDEEDEDWDWGVSASPNWIVFFDAARGWAHDESKSRGATDTETLYDVGAGILLGDVGLYTAVPLTGEDRGLRFFVRLGPRF
jgi:hypothetical protein